MTISATAPIRMGRNCSPLPWVDPKTNALFLDLDGTLLEIASTPDSVMVPQSLLILLSNTRVAFCGALAIITGRRIVEVDQLLQPLRLAASGVHGCEIRPDSYVDITAAPPIDPDILTAIVSIAESFPGVLVEPKGSGIAVHYRLSPSRRHELEKEICSAISGHATKLVTAAGRMVIEIIPFGRSKGTGLEALMLIPPFAGRHPVMIGDDAGDRSAFDAAVRLGGHALRVAGEYFPPEVSEFDCPTAVHAWLRSVIGIVDKRSVES